jgi:hypothetical protein
MRQLKLELELERKLIREIRDGLDGKMEMEMEMERILVLRSHPTIFAPFCS